MQSAVRIVDVRGRAMQACADAEPGGMVAVLGLERDRVEEVCDASRGTDVLSIANVLCPGILCCLFEVVLVNCFPLNF